MTARLRRRLGELERRRAGPGRTRFVWWEEGQPKPEPEPGDGELVIMSRLRSDEEGAEGAAASSAGGRR